ncbi:MAG: ATP-binding protein [Desulfobacteraceae bacterium]|nr:ATP-binding protein [Desulfobacteraceae bacterium]
MKNVFIQTSNVTAFNEAVNVVSDTVKGQPGLMVAWGYAGRGKTEGSRTYCVRTQGAAYIRVFEGWTPRAMLSKICFEINGMQPNRVEQAKQILIEELGNSGNAKILFLDEADRLSMTNIEHLRDIHDETGTPIVLIGEPSLYGRLTSKRRIWERVTRVVEFKPVNTEDVMLFGLKAAELKIKPDAANDLVRRCKGSFRMLYHLMVDLERKTRANKTQDVTLEMIESLPNRRLAPTPEESK